MMQLWLFFVCLAFGLLAVATGARRPAAVPRARRRRRKLRRHCSE